MAPLRNSRPPLAWSNFGSQPRTTCSAPFQINPPKYTVTGTGPIFRVSESRSLEPHLVCKETPHSPAQQRRQHPQHPLINRKGTGFPVPSLPAQNKRTIVQSSSSSSSSWPNNIAAFKRSNECAQSARNALRVASALTLFFVVVPSCTLPR